tara:strand:- start:459 stop:797 length:339 start_codon:yes stop_codon:yes gene_type:complete
MSDKAEIVARTVETHAGVDRGMQLALAMGLKGGEYASAKALSIKVAGDDRWMNQRSPHGLMVDCLYLCAKRKGIKTSAVKVRNLSFQILGVGTQPRPNGWQGDFADLIEGWL